jgi:hypothetical protein
MDKQDILELLEAVRAGRATVAQGVERLRHLPYEDLGFAKIDHHRGLRQGFAEVIYGKGKTPAQVAAILRGMLRPRTSNNVLITRGDLKLFRTVHRLRRDAKFHPLSGAITIRRNHQVTGQGTILILAAGTSDIPVAEEAAVTAEIMGNRVASVYDVGVAGLHRLLKHREQIAAARVIICVAGMEGALPSVVAGLAAAPVIAVPTSVGYGASFGGVTALLAMLNSCASNVCVVNIDNGFGAGYAASAMNRR